jgi:hypothetical protein
MPTANQFPHSVRPAMHAWTSLANDTFANNTSAAITARSFNKLRFALMPKWYPYIHAEPAAELGCPFELSKGMQPPSTEPGDQKCERCLNDGYALVCCASDCEICGSTTLYNRDSTPWWTSASGEPCTHGRIW